MVGVAVARAVGLLSGVALCHAGECAEKSVENVCNCDSYSSKGYQCSSCKDKNFWGYGCDLPCPADDCPHGCDFLGDCINPTQANCKHSSRMDDDEDGTHASIVVNDRMECQTCKDGIWYGYDCEFPCLGSLNERHCAKGPEGYCTRGGACFACEIGWYGDNCTHRCPSACPECVMKDNLVRISGDDYFAAGSCSGLCEGSYSTGGMFGPTCAEACPSNCKTYPDKSSCRKDNGFCLKCQDHAHWGDKCETACGEGCKHGRCDKETGACEYGCQDGYWGAIMGGGPNCHNKCSPNCASGKCDIRTGHCTSGAGILDFLDGGGDGDCKPGWWQKDCSERCPEGTVHDCDQNTGLPKACNDGMYPAFLQDQEIGFYKSAFNGALSVRDAAALRNSNKIGKLSAGSLVRVTDHQVIDGVARIYYDRIVSGVGPSSGWITKRMKSGQLVMEALPTPVCETCPGNCINEKCNADGSCEDGCEPGTWGTMCDQSCNAHCDARGCDVKHAGSLREGFCRGCKDGWTGMQCGNPCDASCEACTQTGAFHVGAAGAQHCTKCPADEPVLDVTGDYGACECIPGATRNPDTGKCECDEPENEPRKQAYFELSPAKLCRFVCIKTGPIKYVEVFGDRKSACITRQENNAVLKWSFDPANAGKECQPGSCQQTGECEFALATGEKFCLLKDYVEYVTR